MAELPDVDETFPARPPPDVDELFPASVEEGRRYRAVNTGTERPSPVQDFLFRSDGPVGSRFRSIGATLDAFGQGFRHGWGAEPLGLSDESIKALKEHGVFNDWQAGEHSLVKAANATLIRPAAAALDATWRGLFQAPFAGFQEAIAQSGEREGFPQLGREIAAVPEAFMGTPHPTGTPRVAVTPADIAKAAELKVIGPEGEAGFRGVAPEAAPGEAAPGAAPMAAEAAAPAPVPPDLHAIVRAAEPKLFEEYDALTRRRDTFRKWIDELGEGRAEADMKRVAADLKETEGRLRQLAPQVQNAYRQAEGTPPARAEPATAPAEPPAEAPPAAAAPKPEEPAASAPAPEPAVPAAERPPVEPPAATAAAERPASPEIEAQRAAIRNEITDRLVRAGRPREEAQAAADLWRVYFEAKAARFQGKKGTAQDIFEREMPDILKAGEKPSEHIPQARKVDEDKLSLTQFLANRGGLQRTGDTEAIFGKNQFIPGFGHLFRKTGMPLDRAREAAVEAGYLTNEGRGGAELRGGGTSSVKDLLDALHEESRGRKIYRGGEQKTPTAEERLGPDRPTDNPQTVWDDFAARRQGPTRGAPIETGYNPTTTKAGAQVRARAGQAWTEGNTVDVGIVKNLLVTSKDADGEFTLLAKPDADGMSQSYSVKAHEGLAKGKKVDFLAATEHLREHPEALEPHERLTEEMWRSELMTEEDYDALTFQRKQRDLIREREAEGQMGLPGAERIGQGELARRKANEPLRPSVEQKPMDVGLFGEKPGQGELFQDSAARMRRAKAMGFYIDMPLYHGSGENFSAFRAVPTTERGLQTPGVSVAPDPAVANEFAVAKPGNAQASPQVYPLLHRADHPAMLTLDGTETHAEIVGALKDAFDAGHDAVMIKNYTTPGGQTGKTIIIVKDANQLRSPHAAFDPAERASPQLLFQREMAPPFYSAVERAVTSAKQEKASPDQWLGMLRNTPGVKAEEMEWLGLADWLKEQKGSVTKQQVADYVRANRIEVKEVQRGAGGDEGWRVFDSGGEWSDRYKSEGEAIEARDDFAREMAAREWKLKQPRYDGDDWKLYSVEDDDVVETFESEEEADQALERRRDESELSWRRDISIRGGELPTRFGNSDYLIPGGKNQRELVLTLPDQIEPYKPDHVHFTEEGGGTAIAWVRFNDRVIDGKKTLLVEEVQSKRHQDARLKGYKGEPSADLPALEAKLETLRKARIADQERVWREASDGRYSSRREVLDAADHDAKEIVKRAQNLELTDKKFNDLVAEYVQAQSAVTKAREQQANRVPDAPFKATWPELAMKRMIRYAAENGYEKIAWTSGETQAARYDLSKTVRKVTIQDQPESSPKDHPDRNKVRLSAWDHNGREVINQLVAREELPDHIGEEAADKILAQEPQNKLVPHAYPREQAATRSLEGLDLKVGGEGMKGFYDQILPAAVNKLVKKFDAKVGKGEVNSGFKPQDHYEGPVQLTADEIYAKAAVLPRTAENIPIIEQLDRIGNAVARGEPLAEAAYRHGSIASARALGGDIVKTPDIHPVHTVDITDKLRDAATEQGFPLFQTVKGSLLRRHDMRSVLRLTREADASSIIHETGHEWLHRLILDAADPDAPADLQRDAVTMLRWIGADPNAKAWEITRKQHEKFARGTETYLMEGRAPSRELAAVFARFKQWLTDIYKTLTALRAPLNDEVRAVFDRMLQVGDHTVIAAEHELPKNIADIHEDDAVHTPAPSAHAAAETIQGERDSVAGREIPEHEDARLGNVAPEARGRAAGSAEPDRARNAPQPDAGEAGDGAAPGAVRAGRGEAAGEGAGVRADAGERAGGGEREAGPGPSTVAPPSAAEPYAPSSALIDKAGNIRVDLLGTPEDINKVIRDAADTNNQFIEARRGVISDQQVLDLADALGMDPARLDTRRIGQAFNAEEIVAARRLLIQSATAVRDAMAKAAEGNDADVLAFAEARQRHLMIQEHVAGITAEAGRALRAFRAMAGMKEATEIGEILRDTTGLELFQLRKMAQLGSKLPTPQAVSQFVHKSTRPGFMDMVLEYWINALISGPATHTTYMIGNEMLALLKAGPETAAAAAIGSVRAAFGAGAERVRWGEVPAQLFGMFSGTRRGIVAAWEAAKSGKTEALPGELAAMTPRQMAMSPLVNTREAIPMWAGGPVWRLPSRGVAVIHSFFRAQNYERELAALAYRDAAEKGLSGDAFARRVADVMTNPSADMMQAARASATDLTLMGKGGELTRALSQLTNARFLGFQWLKFVDPFVHISSNVIEQSILHRTPVGILDPEIRANLAGTNGPVARDMAIARMVVGSSIGVAVGSLAAQGLINGSGPSNPREAALHTMVNGPPHSVRIGDMWYDIHRLGPLGMLVGISADLYHLAHVVEKEEGAKIASEISHAFTQNILDESFMRGPADLIKALSDPDRYGAGWVRNFASSFVPFSVGQSQITRGIDPYSRSARTTLDAIKAKVPWLSQTLLPRRDVFGEPIPNKEALGLAGLSAIYEAKVNNDPVPKAMLEAGYFPAMPERKLRGVDLTEQQYDDYARVAGRMAKMRLDAIVRNPGFANLPPGVRLDMMRNAVAGARQTAGAMVLMNNTQIIKDATDAKLAKLRGEKPKAPAH